MLTPTFLAVCSESPYNFLFFLLKHPLTNITPQHSILGPLLLSFETYSLNHLIHFSGFHLYAEAVCLMAVIHMALPSSPDPHIQLLTGHLLKSMLKIKHLKTCFSSRTPGVTNYPGTQATQLGLTLDSCPYTLIPTIRIFAIKCPKYC